MDQRTSPTRRSCHQYWNNLPDHQKTEILSRREWTTSTLLINLPQDIDYFNSHVYLVEYAGGTTFADTSPTCYISF